MKPRLLSLTLAALVGTGLPALCEEAPAADKGLTPKQLTGMYQIVSGEKNGERIPDERIRGSLVRFTEDTIVSTDKDKKELYAAKYTLEAGQTPAVIAMTSTHAASKGQQARGLIEKEGDTVKLIYALPDKGAMPTAFQTKQGQLLLVLKAVKE